MKIDDFRIMTKAEGAFRLMLDGVPTETIVKHCGITEMEFVMYCAGTLRKEYLDSERINSQ